MVKGSLEAYYWVDYNPEEFFFLNLMFVGSGTKLSYLGITNRKHDFQIYLSSKTYY